MSEYNDAVESALVEEEQVVEAAEEEGGRAKPAHQPSYVPIYITGVSLLVTLAALLTAFSADSWMERTLSDVADGVEYYTLRVEMRCHEIQRDLAEVSGRPLESHLGEEMRKTAADLQTITANRTEMETEAASADRAHYILATGIMFLQMATALAAVVGITQHMSLMYASIAFACSGAAVTGVGVLKYMS